MENIKSIIEQKGKENCFFLVPMHKSQKAFYGMTYVDNGTKQHLVPCVIEESRYLLCENYKITLKPVFNGFSSEDFYTLDLNSLVREGIITMFVKNEKKEWIKQC